jgi:hypothetical protein
MTVVAGTQLFIYCTLITIVPVHNNLVLYTYNVDRYSVFGTATRYVLEGARHSATVERALGPTQFALQWVPVHDRW